MAVIYGESGAWKAVYRFLKSHGLELSCPSDIARKSSELAAASKNIRASAAESYERRLQQLVNHVNDTETWYYNVIKADALELAEAVKAAESTISASIVRLPIPLIANLWAGARLYFERRRLETVYESRAKAADRALDTARKHLEQHRDRKSYFIKTFQENLNRQRHALNDAKCMKEYTGAIGEFEVKQALRQMADSYYVFCDVHVLADYFMLYYDMPLRSAQVDFLIIGPAGVFVIEAKLWSHRFVASGNYFDPFLQVSRAACLIEDKVSRAGVQADVTSVIAAAGAIPRDSEDFEGYIDVVHPKQLPRYITRRPRVLEDFEVVQLVEFFM